MAKPAKENSTANVLILAGSPEPFVHPCELGHRWAWAQLVSGGAVPVCAVCGAPG